MLYGAIATGSCYLVAAITLKEASLHPENKTSIGAVTVAMFFLYYFCYGTSFAKVPWVYNSEVNSLGWRTRGAAAATATNWIGGFITVQFTKVGVNNLGWGFYLCKTSFPTLSIIKHMLTQWNSIRVFLLLLLPYHLPLLSRDFAPHS
jgi:hypothetical protein